MGVMQTYSLGLRLGRLFHSIARDCLKKKKDDLTFSSFTVFDFSFSLKMFINVVFSNPFHYEKTLLIDDNVQIFLKYLLCIGHYFITSNCLDLSIKTFWNSKIKLSVFFKAFKNLFNVIIFVL